MKNPKKRLTSFEFSFTVVLFCILIGAILLLSIILKKEFIYVTKVKIIILLSFIILITLITILLVIFKWHGDSKNK